MDLKGLIKDEHIEMLINDLVPEEPMFIGIKRNFDTACWSFNKKANKHTIYVGDKILDKVKKIGKLGIDYYAISYLHHEMSHAIHTDRDMVSLNEWLQKNKIPFSLFNIFEDARIEYLWRDKHDRLFKWIDYEDVPELDDDSNATSILFVYIQYEGKFRSSLSKLKRVKEYYDKIIDCKYTTDLYPIMIEWMKEFPETQEDLDQLAKDGFIGNGSTPLSSGDLSASVEMQSNSAAAEEMDEDTEEVVGKSPYNDEDNPVELVEELSNIEYDYTTNNTDYIFEPSNTYHYDKTEALKLIPIMEKIFKAKNRKISQADPTNKLNIRSFTASRFDKLYKKKITKSKGKKKINLMIDCSGSMGGNPIQHARTFCYMLNVFAQKKFLDGYVILTGADSYSHQTMTFKLPMKEADIGSIIADGNAEGLKGTIDKTRSLIKNSDYTFVITDGNITDNAVDTKGLNLFGMYVGNPEECDLSKWFSKYIARDNLAELIQKLVIQL